MSIVSALISRRDGVVASDGRIFSSAWIENGNVARPAVVESDSFDKTFTLADVKEIGAFAGLTRFSGKTVGEHVSEVAAKSTAIVNDFTTLTNLVQESVAQRLCECFRAHGKVHDMVNGEFVLLRMLFVKKADGEFRRPMIGGGMFPGGTSDKDYFVVHTTHETLRLPPLN